jgi:hypothetical protein
MPIDKRHYLDNESPCICRGIGPTKRPVTEANVNETLAAFVRSPVKSTGQAT